MPDGRTPLHYAAVKQGSKALVVLLESGLNPNVQDKKGRTALHIAAENASPDNCLVLLSHRASISIKDYCNYTPMRYAIAKPSPKVVLAMLEHGADMKEFEIESVDKLTDKGRGKSNGGGIHGGGLRGDQPEAVASLPLSWAARNGDSEVLKYVYSRLENSKTNSMLYDAFCAAIDAKHRDNAEFLLSQGLKLSESVPSANAANPLSTAFYQNNLKLMKYLIKIGHPINPPASDNGAKDKQNSPLFDVSQSIHYNQGICYASYGMISGKERILEIKSSQDSNLKNILYISLSQDYKKQKLQQESIQKPKDDAAQLLIDNGANVDCSNADGDTALFFVTSRSRLVKRFLEKGANVHARNKSGDTVLMYCKNMSPESCELLIKAGADVNARGKNGFSPLIAAVESCNVAVARVLLKHGADPTKTNYRGKTPYEIGGAIGFPPMKKVFEEAKIKR